MKSLKHIFSFVLVVIPLLFAFSNCGGDDSNEDSNNNFNNNVPPLTAKDIEGTWYGDSWSVTTNSCNLDLQLIGLKEDLEKKGYYKITASGSNIDIHSCDDDPACASPEKAGTYTFSKNITVATKKELIFDYAEEFGDSSIDCKSYISDKSTKEITFSDKTNGSIKEKAIIENEGVDCDNLKQEMQNSDDSELK